MSAPDSIDADSPWLGLASFTEETRALFFGREQEVAELERRVQRKLLTVLFGKSGLGKTSILQAGLVPGLRAQGYFPVYLRIDYGHDSSEPAEQIKQAINRAAGGIGGVGVLGGAEGSGGGAVAGAERMVVGQRGVAAVAIWLSMALAREGKRAEAARTIGPVVTMYRALEKKNQGDQLLPLESAEALYAQSLVDDRHRPALLREAAQRVDHLIPAIARLHDTRAWRARIEAAQRRASEIRPDSGEVAASAPRRRAP